MDQDLSLTLAKSCDLDLALSIKIVNLQCPKKFRATLSRDLCIDIQLWSANAPLFPVYRTPHKVFSNSSQPYTWNELVTLPIKYKDLALDAQLAFTIYDMKEAPALCEAVPVGATTLRLFGSKCTLRKGKQRMFLHPGVTADASVNSTTPSKVKAASGSIDEMARLEKIMKKQQRGDIARLDWLDTLAYREMERVFAAELDKSTSCYLFVDLPTFDAPVVFSELECAPPTLRPLVADASASAAPNQAFPTLTSNNAASFMNDWALFKLIDPEIARENIVEAKHRRLIRGHRSGPLDRELKPNPKIRDQLNDIMHYPPTRALTHDERDLIWRFRFHLSRNKKALNKFLKSVVWTDLGEVKQAVEEFLPNWADIEVEDALELLGPAEAFRDARVRAFAVKALARADDEELMLYLLQLVQALKFEAAAVQPTTSKNRSRNKSRQSTSLQTLESFLIERSVKNAVLGNYLYWYLMCEAEDEQDRKVFKKAAFNFMTKLEQLPDGATRRDEIRRQAEFTAALSKTAKELRQSKDSRPKKIEKLKAAISDSKGPFGSFPSIPLPLDATKRVVGVNVDQSTVFKSNMFPLRLQVKLQDGGEYPLIFKNGDDLRQDQLVIQLFTLMDRLLRNENLDLCLMPYRVLATTPTDGMLQFVPSSTLGAISAEYSGSILAYLRAHHPDEGSVSTFGVDPSVLETYVRSCAGYCVMTYLLGVGDRHLDNLLLSTDGHFFHVDFGYILGRDPKPFPPAVKLSKEMVDAMGGMQSPHYARFKKLCFTAYTSLRKSANLIINLVALMVDARIPDIKLEPDKAVLKVEDKFRLDLSEEEAVKNFDNILNETSTWAAVLDRCSSFPVLNPLYLVGLRRKTSQTPKNPLSENRFWWQTALFLDQHQYAVWSEFQPSKSPADVQMASPYQPNFNTAPFQFGGGNSMQQMNPMMSGMMMNPYAGYGSMGMPMPGMNAMDPMQMQQQMMQQQMMQQQMMGGMQSPMGMSMAGVQSPLMGANAYGGMASSQRQSVYNPIDVDADRCCTIQ